MLRYALAQLRDGQQAEEAVQEALLDALESIGSFGSSNCWVILHRSRIALRACLEKGWFGKDADRGG